MYSIESKTMDFNCDSRLLAITIREKLPQAANDIIALVASGAHPALTKYAVPQFKDCLAASAFLLRFCRSTTLVVSEGHKLFPAFLGAPNRFVSGFFDS
jgi:hypothetical protein